MRVLDVSSFSGVSSHAVVAMVAQAWQGGVPGYLLDVGYLLIA